MNTNSAKGCATVLMVLAVFAPHQALANSSQPASDPLSISQVEAMVDDGRVLTCESLKLASCTDPSLEEAAARDYMQRGISEPTVYLLANRKSGNVWGLRLTRASPHDANGSAELSAEALPVPDQTSRQWLEYLELNNGEK